MDRRKERMKDECKRIVESINSMSFVNLDDQRVQALVMMREIARGVLHNRVEKVRERGRLMKLLFIIIIFLGFHFFIWWISLMIVLITMTGF